MRTRRTRRRAWSQVLTINHPARDVPKVEYFDNIKQEFITIEARHIDAVYLKLEHSLRSIADWESRWHTAFVGRENMTPEELLDYIRCMTTNQIRNPDVYEGLTQEDINRIVAYMQDPCSAWEMKTGSKDKKKKTKKADTAEMYYWAMIQYGVPLECQNWHFNRLLALLDYCGYKGGSTSGAGGPKKKSEREIMEMYRALNEKNRKKYNSKG